MSNNLKANIYLSQQVQPFSKEDLLELNEFCIAHNKRHGVTGYLWCNGNQFLQYFEGQAKSVDALMRNIQSDSRHSLIFHIGKDIKSRQFGGWAMEHIGLSNLLAEGTEQMLSSQILLLNARKLIGRRVDSNIWKITESLAKFKYLLNGKDDEADNQYSEPSLLYRV